MSGSSRAASFVSAISLLMLLSATAGAADQPAAAPATSSAPAQPPAADYTSPDIGTLTTGKGKPSADTDTWPQFRGANRDGIAAAPSVKKLYRTWPAEGPKVLWTIDKLGQGYGGAAVFGGRVFFHDYDEAAGEWMIRCVSPADAQEIWRWSYKRDININHGYTRTVPATDGQIVVSLDPKLVLHVFDAATGKRLWAKDLARQYGARIPSWYNGQCPLLEGDRIIIGVGGRDVFMTALDKRSGKTVWETPNPHAHAATHASVMPFTVGDEKQYVLTTIKGAVGVRAADGALRWEALGPRNAEKATAAQGETLVSIPWQPKTAQVPSALNLGDGKLFLTTGYKVGSIALEITPGDPPGVKVLYTMAGESKPDAQAGTVEQGVFETDCHTPILWQGHLYGVDHAFGKHSGFFTCLKPDGTIVWRHLDVPLSLGTSLLADGLIFLEDGNTGTIRLVAADPAGYKELGKKELDLGHDAWGPMAYANGKIIVRGLTKLVCLQVGETR